MSRPAVRVRNRTRHKMKANVRHGIHGKPRICQKRGRAATQSHRLNPNEPRRPKELRPVAASRCTAPTRGPNVLLKAKEPKVRELKLHITYKCDDCGGKLEREGQSCTKKISTNYYPYSRQCTGHAVRHEDWV